jgi:hypothetical protein
MNRRVMGSLVLLGCAMVGRLEGNTVSGTVRINPDLPAGADAEGRLLLYTPKPVQAGSSHSHFDSSANPNLLMEPSVSGDLKAFRVDLTKPAMLDMGWEAGNFNAEVSYTDGGGVGFNDPTLGAQRKAALEAAVAAWGSILGSAVTVHVEAAFRSLTCSEDGGTLASAGPDFVYKDFAGGIPGIWYAGTLAESLAGSDLSATNDPGAGVADLSISFNSEIDNECLGAGSMYYYGLDNNLPAGGISFVSVAMHEIGHGLGFLGFTTLRTGALFRGGPDIYTTMTYDTKKKKYWHEMDNDGRKKSAIRERKVSFDGSKTTKRGKRVLKGSPIVEVTTPSRIAGSYPVGTATFGPSLSKKGISGDLAIVDDGSVDSTFGCLPLINGGEVAGKIAVIDRGECLFVEKVRNAQDAGAVAVIIVHNELGFPPTLGGTDSSIEIPAVRIGKKDGRKIKRKLRQ